MLFFPVVMNALQYYIIDSFIKDQKPNQHEPLPSDDGEEDDMDESEDEIEGVEAGEEEASLIKRDAVVKAKEKEERNQILRLILSHTMNIILQLTGHQATAVDVRNQRAQDNQGLPKIEKTRFKQESGIWNDHYNPDIPRWGFDWTAWTSLGKEFRSSDGLAGYVVYTRKDLDNWDLNTILHYRFTGFPTKNPKTVGSRTWRLSGPPLCPPIRLFPAVTD